MTGKTPEQWQKEHSSILRKIDFDFEAQLEDPLKEENQQVQDSDKDNSDRSTQLVEEAEFKLPKSKPFIQCIKINVLPPSVSPKKRSNEGKTVSEKQAWKNALKARMSAKL